MIDVYVACRSEKYADRWLGQQKVHKEAQINIRTGNISYYQFIREVMVNAHGDYILVCQDDIWLGKGFFARANALIEELNTTYPNWGVASNHGTCIHGTHTYHYLRAPLKGPEKSAFPKLVAAVGPNIQLINLKALRERKVELPEIKGFQGYDVLLSLICLKAGLLNIADHRLFVYHESSGNKKSFQTVVQSKPYQEALQSLYINHAFPSVYGTVIVDKDADYSYLTRDGNDERQDVFAAFDNALASVRNQKRPTVAIYCRTQFKRNALLTRAILSFANAAAKTTGLVDLSAVVITDQSEETLQAEIAKLQLHAPMLDLRGESYTIRNSRFSRTDLLLQAIESCTADYIWFVDDDDFIYPDALPDIGRYVADNKKSLLIGDCQRLHEKWTDVTDAGSFVPDRTSTIDFRRGAEVFNSYATNDNLIPFCASIFPAEIMKKQIAQVDALGDFCEDYFLLLLALGAPEIEVLPIATTVCGVSVRGTDNTVTAMDRSHWHYSYATFLGEILDRNETGSPAFWAFAESSHYDAGNVMMPARAQDHPRLVRYLVFIGYAIIAFWRVLRHPGSMMTTLKGVIAVWKTKGFRGVCIKIIQFGQRC